MDNIYYVYQYLREDGTPYYIGKGKDNRAYYKNPSYHIQPPKNTTQIIIVQENMLEDEAFVLEKQLIAKYGRKDIGTGILRNRTDGGEGASGTRHTVEQKEKWSKMRTGVKRPGHSKWMHENNPFQGKTHSDEYKQRMSGEGNPMFGKTHTKEARQKISEAHTGRKRPEHSKRMSGKNSPNYGGKHNRPVCCLSCNREISNHSNYVRWHVNRDCSST